MRKHIATPLLMLLVSFADGAASAESPTAAAAKASPSGYLQVDYADTLLGMQAKLAVAKCANEEAPRTAGIVVRATLAPVPEDIVVHLIGADGREISRTIGAAAVCQYARFAAAYIVRTWPQPVARAR